MLAARTMALATTAALAAALATFAPSARAQAGADADALLTIDHYVAVRSTVPVDLRSDHGDLRARARAGRNDPARRAARCARRAVRARRGHAGGSRVRRAVRRLQLDGVPRQRGLRRVLDGHDGLRPLDASGRDERGLQPAGRAAGARSATRRARGRSASSSRRSRRTGTTSTQSSTTCARCAASSA